MTELLLNILLFLLGFVFLIFGANALVRGASRIAVRMAVPAAVIGLTIVAFGTSLPELLVSIMANQQDDGSGSIAIGNVVGSNIANVGLILGIAAILVAIPVERHMLRREYPFMLIASLLFTAMAWDGEISRLEGIILIAGLLAFMAYSFMAERILSGEEALDVAESIDPGIGHVTNRLLWEIGLIVVGIAGLMLGARWLVTSAEFLARSMGVSELVIGLSLVALGTSLPELATTVVAVRRQEGDIAVGNVVGSNLFNILAIVGITALIKPLPTPVHLLRIDFPVMIGMAILAYLFAFRTPHILGRWMGGVLLLIYLAYNIWLFTALGAV